MASGRARGRCGRGSLRGPCMDREKQKKTIYVPFSTSLGARTSISVRGRKKYWVEKKLKIDVMNEVKCAIGSPAFLRQVSLHKFSSRGSNSELESLELCYNALNAICFFFSL